MEEAIKINDMNDVEVKLRNHENAVRKSQIIRLLLDNLKNFSFNMSAKGECIEIRGSLPGAQGHSHEIGILAHMKSSAVLVVFFVCCSDDLQQFVLCNVKKKMRKEYSIEHSNHLEAVISGINSNMEVMDAIFLKLHQFVMSNKIAPIVVSKNQQIKKRYSAVVEKLKREIRELIPAEIRFFPYISYHFSHERSDSFFRCVAKSDKV